MVVCQTLLCFLLASHEIKHQAPTPYSQDYAIRCWITQGFRVSVLSFRLQRFPTKSVWAECIITYTYYTYTEEKCTSVWPAICKCGLRSCELPVAVVLHFYAGAIVLASPIHSPLSCRFASWQQHQSPIYNVVSAIKRYVCAMLGPELESDHDSPWAQKGVDTPVPSLHVETL